MAIFRTGTPVWKKVLATLLCVGVVAGGAYGIKKIHDSANEDLKTIHPTFHVGGLDENGKYVDTDQSLYSDAFECEGLEVKLDFDNDIIYDIYYYDENETFLNSTYCSENYKDFYNVGRFDIGDIYDRSFARIVITPQWTNVEIPEDKTEEDVKVVKWSNILEFSSQLEIKVLKDQDKYKDVISLFKKVDSNSVSILDNKGFAGNKLVDDENHSVLKISNFNNFNHKIIVKYNESDVKKYSGEVMFNYYGSNPGNEEETGIYQPFRISAFELNDGVYSCETTIPVHEYATVNLCLICINGKLPTIEVA